MNIPSGATHQCEDRYAVSTGGIQYYKFEQGQWFYWPEAVEPRHVWKCCKNPCKPVIAIQSTWNGPEEGFPPVGFEVEFREFGGDFDWKRAKLVYLSEHTALMRFDGEGDAEAAYSPQDCEFRPVRTPEQIAAEEREAAIKEMREFGVDAGDSTIDLTCAALYDAGYRKSEIVKEDV